MASFGGAPISLGAAPAGGGLRGRVGSINMGGVQQSANTDSGIITFDFNDPLGSLGESIGNIGDFATGLVGDIPVVGPALGAVGEGLEAVGNIGLPTTGEGNSLPTNPTLGGTLGGGGQATLGKVPGAMLDLVGLPGRAIERTVAQRRLEARGDIDWLSAGLDSLSRSILWGLGLAGIAGEPMQNPILQNAAGMTPELPQDILDRLDAGELTIDQAADEMVGRNAGFSNDPGVNLAESIIYDPTNLIGGVFGKGQKLMQQAGVAVDLGRASGAERFFGQTYNAATHGLTATQQRFIGKLAGPVTAGVAQAIGPAAVKATIDDVTGALGSELGGRFTDALANGNAHYIRSAAGHAIELDARRGITEAAGKFTDPDAVARLIDEAVTARKGINPKQLIRDVEDYARRTLPSVIDRGETIRKLARITGVTEADAAKALGKRADDIATQQTVHLAYWGHIADRLAEAKALYPPTAGLDTARLTPIAPDTLTDQRAVSVFKITQDAAGKTVIGASDDEIAAAVGQFDDLAKFRGGAFDATKVRAYVAKLYEGDYLPQTLNAQTLAKPNAIPSKLGDIRAEMNEFGYELGFGPKEGWRTILDADGNVVRQSPFVVVSSAKDPLTIRNGFGRFMDNMFRGITQERIIIESRMRLARDVAKLGVNEREAQEIHSRILGMARELQVAPRGLAFGGERTAAVQVGDRVATIKLNRYDQAFLDVIGEQRFVALIARHDPTTLAMKAFKGNLGTVGITQAISGAAKAIPRYGKGVAGIAENLYPNLKFRYNAMFQTQELIETPFWRLLRGIPDGDADLTRVYQGLIEGADEFRFLSGAEYTLNIAGAVNVTRSFGDGLIGRLTSRMPDIASMKSRAEVAQVIIEHPDEFQAAIVRINPRFWRIMEETYGTTDAAAITRAFVKERVAGTSSLPDALKQIDEALVRPVVTATTYAARGIRELPRGEVGKYVHYTSRERAERILAEGFRPSSPSLGGASGFPEGTVFVGREGSPFMEQMATEYYAKFADSEMVRLGVDIPDDAKLLDVSMEADVRDIWNAFKDEAVVARYKELLAANKGAFAYKAAAAQLAREMGYDGIRYFYEEVALFPRSVAARASGAGIPDSDYAMETIWSAFRQSARTRAEVAFRTQYFSASRSFFERSLNHPFLGLYPLSYMYGKVLPEFARFLLLRPFGQRAPLVGMAALQKVQEAYVAALATDPEFATWIEEHPESIHLANMLIPGSPTDISARLPGWATSFSEANAAGRIEDRTDAINTFASGAQRSLTWSFGAPVNAFVDPLKVLNELVPEQRGRVEEALDNAASMYDGMFPLRP